MARLPRLTVPGYPHHIIQRGNNRQPIVTGDTDRRELLTLLETYSREADVAVHAYVLMDNHLHLLATPQTERGLAQLMQSVGRRYVRWFNDRQQRSGTLWEGRYRSTVVQADRYLLACMAYIDLNPVRAGMVGDPVDYAWSSHRHYAGRVADRLVTPHPLVWELGNTPFAREQAYVQLVAAGISDEVQSVIRASTQGGWAAAEPSVWPELALSGGRRPDRRRAGRPKRSNDHGVDLSPISDEADLTTR